LRRNVSIEEVGDSAVFLASDLSRAITGEVLHVDCGLHSVIPGFDVAPLVGTGGGYEK
jgi:enoyl-[acyl-carrier-protein] reductase (NADH)